VTLSKQKFRWVIAGLCIVAAIRVFVFTSAFPLFNNVDEQAHVDLVLKYAHGQPPRGVELYSTEAGQYFTLYGTPEYFVAPEHYGGQYPPPKWWLTGKNLQDALDDEVPFWAAQSNHESGEPPLYYAIAGGWFDLGQILGLRGLVSLYWLRFLNVAFAAALVWIGSKAAGIVFPDRSFPAIAVAGLLAVWPQSSFYSVQADSLSPLIFGLGFIALGKLLEAERPDLLQGMWIGLAVAAACLTKTANLPLLLVAAVAVSLKVGQLVRRGDLSGGVSVFAVFAVAAALPLGLWMAWNQQHFGDLTATRLKIEQLGWTPKAFIDWWSHPIFTPVEAKEFWMSVITSFWRGEFIWHRARLAEDWSDAFYWTASTIAFAITLSSLVVRGKSEPKRALLWIGIISFLSLFGFLVLISIRYDFGTCQGPSRERPFLASGRLLNAAAVPFFILFAYAIEKAADWTKREWVRWGALACTAVIVMAAQSSVNAPAFSSRYNFFHRSAGQ
jgi:hypothetical protein